MTSNHYKCRYCGISGFTKNSLYEHIKKTSSCSSLHRGNRTSRTSRTSRTRKTVKNVQQSQPSDNDIEATPICCVCTVNEPVIAAQCGHQCLCVDCSIAIYNLENKCPICSVFRSTIINMLKQSYIKI